MVPNNTRLRYPPSPAASAIAAQLRRPDSSLPSLRSRFGGVGWLRWLKSYSVLVLRFPPVYTWLRNNLFQPMEKISAIVTCFDRENEIEACLESLRWADEMVVVDSFSRDNTAALARKHADRVFQREYHSPGGQKNWAIGQASHPWIISLDSDEVMPPELRDEIISTLKNPRFRLYKVYRRGIFLGRELKHGGWNRDINYLLFRKEIYRYTEEVHERLLPETEFGLFRNRLIHYTHHSIDEFVLRSNRYATWGAQKYFRKGRRGTAAKMFSHAAYNFLKNYIFRLGFLDGGPGLIVAALSSGYVAEKWAKLWELEQMRKIN